MTVSSSKEAVTVVPVNLFTCDSFVVEVESAWSKVSFEARTHLGLDEGDYHSSASRLELKALRGEFLEALNATQSPDAAARAALSKFSEEMGESHRFLMYAA